MTSSESCGCFLFESLWNPSYGLVATLTSKSKPNVCKSCLLILDRELLPKSWRYLRSSLRPPKFNDNIILIPQLICNSQLLLEMQMLQTKLYVWLPSKITDYQNVYVTHWTTKDKINPKLKQIIDETLKIIQQTACDTTFECAGPLDQFVDPIEHKLMFKNKCPNTLATPMDTYVHYTYYQPTRMGITEEERLQLCIDDIF